jgi:hypothetical protein
MTMTMTTTQETWDLLVDAAVVAGSITEGMAAKADEIWALFTADEQRDTLAIITRQNWGHSSKGNALARYALSCADLMADRA